MNTHTGLTGSAASGSDAGADWKVKSMLMAAAATLALAAGPASAVPLHPAMMVTGVKIATPIQQTTPPNLNSGQVIWNQNSGATSSAVVSQNFTSGSFSAYDSQAADDFVVGSLPPSLGATEVDVSGLYFNGPGPTTSVNVSFYTNKPSCKAVWEEKKTKYSCPSKLKYEFDNLPIIANISQRPGCIDTSGDFQCFLPLKPNGKAEAKLTAKDTYWVSVVANMSFAAGGEWGWATRTPVLNDEAVWRNQGAFAPPPCTNWFLIHDCVGLPQPVDLMFTIKG